MSHIITNMPHKHLLYILVCMKNVGQIVALKTRRSAYTYVVLLVHNFSRTAYASQRLIVIAKCWPNTGKAGRWQWRWMALSLWQIRRCWQARSDALRWRRRLAAIARRYTHPVRTSPRAARRWRSRPSVGLYAGVKFWTFLDVQGRGSTYMWIDLYASIYGT